MLFERTGVTDVLVVVMPKEPTAIHLDMLFTQVDRELCVVYPPYFLGPERLAVLHRKKGNDGVREMPDFFTALREVASPLQPIFAGGQSPRDAGSGAVDLRMQFPGAQARHDRELPAE